MCVCVWLYPIAILIQNNYLNMETIIESPLNMAPIHVYALQLSHPIYMSPCTPSTSYLFNHQL